MSNLSQIELVNLSNSGTNYIYKKIACCTNCNKNFEKKFFPNKKKLLQMKFVISIVVTDYKNLSV